MFTSNCLRRDFPPEGEIPRRHSSNSPWGGGGGGGARAGGVTKNHSRMKITTYSNSIRCEPTPWLHEIRMSLYFVCLCTSIPCTNKHSTLCFDE